MAFSHLTPGGGVGFLVSTSVKFSPETERLSMELLSLLIRQQYQALQKSSYMKMSQSAAAAYDRRRKRIGELRELLAKIRDENS
jgi:hypothetical protein